MRSLCLAVGGAAVAVSAFTPGSSHAPCHVGIRQLRSATHPDVSSSSVRSTSGSASSCRRQQSTSSLRALPWSRGRSSSGSSSSNAQQSSEANALGCGLLFRRGASDSVKSGTAVTHIVARAVRKAVLAIRRTLAIASAAALVYFGTAHLHAAPSHANASPATATATPIVRMLTGGASASRPSVQLASSTATAASKARLDQMVDRYVKKHMFADDAFDPFESAYREAHADQSSSTYPETLTETAAEILGKREVAKKTAETSADGAFDAALAKLNKFSDFMERKYGINKQLSMSSVFIAIFTVPAFAIMIGATVFGNRQKEMTERLAEQRYGKSMMDVSASEKVDDDIDAPDDDDYDSDDEDDDDDDDDDDE